MIKQLAGIKAEYGKGHGKVNPKDEVE